MDHAKVPSFVACSTPSYALLFLAKKNSNDTLLLVKTCLKNQLQKTPLDFPKPRWLFGRVDGEGMMGEILGGGGGE